MKAKISLEISASHKLQKEVQVKISASHDKLNLRAKISASHKNPRSTTTPFKAEIPANESVSQKLRDHVTERGKSPATTCRTQ